MDYRKIVRTREIINIEKFRNREMSFNEVTRVCLVRTRVNYFQCNRIIPRHCILYLPVYLMKRKPRSTLQHCLLVQNIHIPDIAQLQSRLYDLGRDPNASFIRRYKLGCVQMDTDLDVHTFCIQ